jgi:hypothetical protein
MCNTKNFPVNAVQLYVLHISLYRTLNLSQCTSLILVMYITVYLILICMTLSFSWTF